MKRIFLLLFALVFLSLNAQVQTFKVPSKILNLTQQNTNQKILSVNSGSNVLQWTDRNSLITPTPTLQQVLTAGNGAFNKTLEMQNGSNDFLMLTGYGFQVQNVITGQTKAVYLNNTMGLNIGDGLGRYSVLNNTNGLYLKTTTSGKYSSLKSDLITGTDKVFQFPNNSGTIPLSVNGNFADSSGNITVSGSSYTPPFQTFRSLINQNGTGNPSQIILQNDPTLNFKWTRIAQGIYVSDSIILDPETIFFSLTLRNSRPASGGCFDSSNCFYDSAGDYQLNSFVIITDYIDETTCIHRDDIMQLSEFELLIY